MRTAIRICGPSSSSAAPSAIPIVPANRVSRPARIAISEMKISAISSPSTAGRKSAVAASTRPESSIRSSARLAVQRPAGLVDELVGDVVEADPGDDALRREADRRRGRRRRRGCGGGGPARAGARLCRARRGRRAARSAAAPRSRAATRGPGERRGVVVVADQLVGVVLGVDQAARPARRSPSRGRGRRRRSSPPRRAAPSAPRARGSGALSMESAHCRSPVR